MSEFKIEFLDHVAIRVQDIEASADWYKRVLGLKRYKMPEWGDFPIFMLTNKSGVALFPAKIDDPELEIKSKNIKIDHFAFNVTRENFKKAISRYEELGVEYNFQDHFYFHSIYTKDPDGHTVELTTIVVEEDSFY
ncbi:VOC family protein [Aquimarina sediminis]|uniref:VOC family protein n=1 Tax=Aquimarina sediminis TaxID=2070536 RepID=UPI000CA01676|nr:VOC family protein [Aquimarina sediminis]